jgi:hypothetical protein
MPAILAAVWGTRIKGTGDVTKTNVMWRHGKGVPYVQA